MKLSKYEQETIINFNDGEKAAELYTASPSMIKQMEKLCAEYPESYQIKQRNQYSVTFSITNKSDIKFKKPRNLSEETRQTMKENAEKARKVRNNDK